MIKQPILYKAALASIAGREDVIPYKLYTSFLSEMDCRGALLLAMTVVIAIHLLHVIASEARQSVGRMPRTDCHGALLLAITYRIKGLNG